MLAFSGNSLLCRLALRHTSIDPATFTTIRLASGAAVLFLLTRFRRGPAAGSGNWLSAMALLAYAIAFSLAYVSLPAATGSLLLFGAVQTTMIGSGLVKGERLGPLQSGGLALALAGLIGLLLPGLSAPPLAGASLMLSAGVAWGVYSIRGRSGGDPARVTAGNFMRAVPFTIVFSLLMHEHMAWPLAGVGYAIASGMLASGVGYVIWYSVLPSLKATHAATVQLSVPVITALLGMTLLGEAMTLRFALAALAILGGIAMVILERRPSAQR